MKDPRLVELKLRAEKDRNLSDGAHRSLALIVSDRYLCREFLAGDEFRLSWSDLSRLHGNLSRSTAERRIDELVSQGYLKRETLKGCPAAWWYLFVFRCVKNNATGCNGHDALARAENGASGCRKIDARHISNSLREKIIKKRGVGAAASAIAAAPTRRQPRAMPLDECQSRFHAGLVMAGLKKS
jgi:hypothetical protein